MIDWSLPPDLQQKYNQVAENIQRLQKELGVEPRTIEQRHQDYQRNRVKKEKQKKELEELKRLVQNRRPPPRWKV